MQVRMQSTMHASWLVEESKSRHIAAEYLFGPACGPQQESFDYCSLFEMAHLARRSR